jgi:hypothetical protein
MSYAYPSSGPQRPYSQPVYQPQPYTPPSGGQALPGSITYTTSTGPDGRVIYHPFKCVFGSYPYAEPNRSPIVTDHLGPWLPGIFGRSLPDLPIFYFNA